MEIKMKDLPQKGMAEAIEKKKRKKFHTERILSYEPEKILMIYKYIMETRKEWKDPKALGYADWDKIKKHLQQINDEYKEKIRRYNK